MPEITTSTLPKRPRGLRLLCMTLAGIGLVNLGTGLRAVQFASEYSALGVSFPPALQAVLGLAWGTVFMWAAWQLWRLRDGSSRAVLLAVGTYAVYQTTWWRIFVRSDYALARWPFAVLMLGAWTAAVIWYVHRLSV